MMTFIGRDSIGASKRVDIFGLSTDTKPDNIGNGSTFKEMDTGALYMYDAENEQWLEQ